VYTITSLLFSKVIVICIGGYLTKGAGLPLHKANRFLYIIIGRYRYHENTIINNGFSFAGRCRWTTLVMLRCGSVTLGAALWH